MSRLMWTSSEVVVRCRAAILDSESLAIAYTRQHRRGRRNHPYTSEENKQNGVLERHKYDTRCCFNVRSEADTSQLNLPHGTNN